MHDNTPYGRVLRDLEKGGANAEEKARLLYEKEQGEWFVSMLSGIHYLLGGSLLRVGDANITRRIYRSRNATLIDAAERYAKDSKDETWRALVNLAATHTSHFVKEEAPASHAYDWALEMSKYSQKEGIWM